GRGARRKIAEDELYKKAFSGGRMPNPRSIFYVPIHINAQPWFGMFRWFDPNADDFEKRISNVHFYRDVVSMIAEAVGRATEEAYADAVARVVANTFASTAGRERFLQAANDTLKTLGDSYPYSIVQLGSAGSTYQPDQRNVERLEFPGQDQDLFLTWGKGKASVEYRPLDPKFVKESVERALQRAVLREAAAYKKALEVFGHSIGGVMQASGFGEVAGATRSLKRKFGNDPEVLRLFQSVQFLDRHIKVVQGFGETLRLRKTNGQGFPRQWFGQIVPRAEIDAIAAAAERIALFYLWPRWRMEPKWRTIAIESDGVERIFSIDDEYVSNRAKNLSDLYPFSGPGEGPSSRHSGTIVASLGLAELIFNATNKLIDSIRNNLFSEKVLQQPLMRLRVEKISHTGDGDEYIRITVLNCSAQRPNLEAPKAVQEIQQLERTYMYCRGLPVLETTIPEINEQMSGKPEGCFWVQADWSYHFKRVISEGNTEGAESKP
ncbi:MAG: hypothetical protein JWP08_1719, partial [Bryobacterales bacterium]|nr:hypothetical protein [Bryobacterales bacterium]